MYMPRELSLSSEVPGCSVACETSCPRIVKTLTWIVFWVRIMMVPFRWKISTPSVFLGSVRLFPWTSALVSRHCTLAVARLVAAIVNSIENSTIVSYFDRCCRINRRVDSGNYQVGWKMNSKTLIYIVKRVLLAIFTVWVVITVTFFVLTAR